MSERRLRWSGCLFVCLSAVGASSLYAQTLDPSISGPARIVADRAYAAYQNGDYAIAKAMAQAALQMAPGTDSVRRLLAATESGGTRAGRWSSNPFLITTAMGAMAHGESMAVKVMSPSLPLPTVPVQMPQPTTTPRLSVPSQTLTARPEKAPAAMAAPLTRTPVRPMEPEHALAVQALPSRTAGAEAAASPKLTTATPQKIYDLIKSGDAATATTLANNTLQLHPGDRRMWEAYTNALFAQGKFQEADEAVAKAIKRLGTDDGLKIGRASCRERV